MKKFNRHIDLKQLTPILLLVFLTLFTSCSVRKAVQAHLGIEKAKPLNPHKTTVADKVSCNSVAENIAAVPFLQDSGKSIDFLPLHSADIELTFDNGFSEVSTLPDLDLQVTSLIPFYILYKQLKFWI